MRIMNLMMCTSGRKNFSFRTSNPVHGHLFVRFQSNAVVLTKFGYQNAKPGDYIFYHKHETMHYTSYEGEEFVHDFFRFDMLEDDLKHFNIPTSTLFTAPFSEKLESLLKMLTQEYFTPSALQGEAMHFTGLLFLVSVSEHLSQSGLPFQQNINRPALLDIRFDIYRSPQEPWSVDALAKRAMVSPSYFQHIYKEAFGISPINDVIQARVAMAENLLLFSGKKESEIALLCGYNNVEHFVRQFCKHRHISPSRFRAESKSPQQP